jgi:hypothetical protein
MALWKPVLVACRCEALGDGGRGGEFVGFREEGGSVSFADFEGPVCSNKRQRVYL